MAEGEILAKDVADFEPALALRAGEKGLDIIKELIAQSLDRLDSRGKIFIEIGAGQRPALECSSLLKDTSIIFHKDLFGIDRVLELGC